MSAPDAAWWPPKWRLRDDSTGAEVAFATIGGVRIRLNTKGVEPRCLSAFRCWEMPPAGDESIRLLFGCSDELELRCMLIEFARERGVIT